WNRLVKVIKTGGGSTTVAQYWYDGLNHRMKMQYDVTDSSGTGAPDGTVDSHDPVYHFAYDLRWRVVEVYRASDANPKIQYLYNNAGLDGQGSAGYVDSLML